MQAGLSFVVRVLYIRYFDFHLTFSQCCIQTPNIWVWAYRTLWPLAEVLYFCHSTPPRHPTFIALPSDVRRDAGFGRRPIPTCTRCFPCTPTLSWSQPSNQWCSGWTTGAIDLARLCYHIYIYLWRVISCLWILFCYFNLSLFSWQSFFFFLWCVKWRIICMNDTTPRHTYQSFCCEYT